ncbi:nuclear apoptosis-inducing factor 1 isoform X2 [Xiphophorus hellerii]|uniref:nuclear apoptosis-inducing factor 1 isoform X2 n=1 Tax=Xiphophorus hellerii TaxID=8084 RepID=UPI0013B35802|nr:nuclear apoptosis-inducing factor 1-like isoform X2 [Xiphophorus hellerii]
MSSPVYYNHDSAVRFKKRKARFSFSEVHVLLDEVRKNRSVVVGKFNRGIPTDSKKRTWAEITARVNDIGECQREVIEVIKKWSDLKCDTKRKVAAMRSGTVPNRGLNSRLSRDLTQTEKIVLQILEMDEDDQSTGECGPLGDDDDVPEEEEEMEEEDMMGMQSSPNGGGDVSSMPPPTSYDTEIPFGDSDDDQREDALPSNQPGKSAEVHQVNNGVHKHVQPPMSASAPALAPAPAPSPAVTLPAPAHNSRDSLLQNAALSLQEQHATNMLLETVSRSLELLAESVQQLAETQQEFVRESLQLQRETVQVLRDFTGGAIALMHDKLNGRPAL